MELQLLNCLNRWSKLLDRGSITDVILLDFAKAFDKSPTQNCCISCNMGTALLAIFCNGCVLSCLVECNRLKLQLLYLIPAMFLLVFRKGL